MSSNISDVPEILEDEHGVGILIYIILMALALAFAVISNGLVIYCVARFSEILCKVVNFCPVLVISSSIFTLVTVSFERRQVIIDNQGQGQDSRRRITKRKLIAVIFIIWTLAAAVSVPTYLEYTVQELEVPVGNTTVTVLSCGSQFSRELALANAVFVLIVSYLIPVILLTKNYSQLAFYMWTKLKKIKQNLQPLGRNLKTLRLFMQRTRVIKLLVLVAVIFAVSWFPYFAIQLYAKITGNDTSEHAAGFVNLLLLALAIFSSAYNVVLYVLFNPSFKQAIIGVVKCTKADDLNHHVMSDQSQQTPVSPPVDRSGVVTVVADSSSRIAVITTKSDFTSLELTK